MTHAHVNRHQSLFSPGRNCWRAGKASHAAILIDCANYYQAVYEAVCKAKHSIFLLGWDLDSRIKLLRGVGANGASHAVRFFGLIEEKARENPDLQVYLNSWDYSVFMAKEREPFAKRRWLDAPPNVHYIQDNTVPMGVSHHQKVIVVDDELAFCGGMDITLNRWDEREHFPENSKRIDPGYIYNPKKLNRFEPYHDIQMMVAGPVVQSFAHLTRLRWKRATGEEAPPVRTLHDAQSLPECWPQSFTPDFENVSAAIALTEPQMADQPAVRQIEQVSLDLIRQAEQFIYIENQYFTRVNLAQAINEQLRKKPKLRVLLVSSYSPKGKIEGLAMWHGRTEFRDIIEAGGVADRVAMAYPISKANGEEKSVRIHSKIIAVDDTYLRVGSSNFNNRSMELDTECDLIIEARDEASRQAVSNIRNDLIREHTGREAESIEALIEEGAKAERFLNYITHSRQHLTRINDERYRHARFTGFAKRIADPVKPLLPPRLTVWFHKKRFLRLLAVIGAIAAFALAWKYTPLAEYANPDTVVPMLEQIRATPWAVPAAIGLYTVATLLFFPHMAMTATIVLVFSPLQSFTIAMTGSILSGAIGFYIGKKLGLKSMRSLIGETAEKISGYAKKGGIIGITLLRLLPIAPYTAVNLAIGMLEVPFLVFTIGTFLGTLPGTTIAAFMGATALELWQNPSAENWFHIGLGLAGWIGIIVASHLGARWWKKHKRHTVQA